MITIFSTYITPQIKEIHHPALLQEWKINIDAAEYLKKLWLTCINPLEKRNLTVSIFTNTGQYQKK